LSCPYPPISDYAIIGNCRSAALVSSAGSIDWLCWPRFNSPSVFAALLDGRQGGRFVVSPAGPFTSTRRYVGESAVLETTFRTPTGVGTLTDLMSVTQEGDKADELWPDHEVLRRIECIEGTLDVEVLYDPRPDYARDVPWFRSTPFGLVCAHRNQVFALQSERPVELASDHGGPARGSATLRAGDAWTLSLTYCEEVPAIRLPLGEGACARIDRSVRWWTDWMAACTYDGPWAALVRRSAITLKLMTYSPSGAIVAAPTTSLPEHIGGVRNWDYRYCWLRDSAMTLRALFDLGFSIEGEAFLSWMLHATNITGKHVQVMYDVFGEWRLGERTLDHLEGYCRSAPVRIGNGAADQLQLDIFGEVLDAAWMFVARGGRLDRATRRMLAKIGRTVARRWVEPDEGIWEPRAARQHHTHSKMMCWVALDRLVKLIEAGHVPGEASPFAAVRDTVRHTIERRGYSERLGSYVSIFDQETIDASLLLLSIMGYADPASARMRGTAERIRERLGANGLLYRYLDEHDGLPPGEGAFGICSFWAVQQRVRAGELDVARGEFEHVASFANDLGLFAEEIDPATGAALGNFPQAFTHVGAINAARAIASSSTAAAPPARVEPPGPHDMGEHV
jgi:GH15 family glucan-1,4-alpha-glucosidase